MMAVFLRPDFIPAGVITRSSPFASRSTRDVSFTAKPHQLIIRHRRLCPKSKRGGRSSRVKFIPVVYSQRLDPAPHHGYPHTIMQDHPSGLTSAMTSSADLRHARNEKSARNSHSPYSHFRVGAASAPHRRRFTAEAKDRDRVQRRKRLLPPHHLRRAVRHCGRCRPLRACRSSFTQLPSRT